MTVSYSANAGDSTKLAFRLIQIDFPGGTWRCTDADLPIVTVSGAYPGGGNPGAFTFPAERGFAVEGITAGSALTAASERIVVDNTDNYFSAVAFNASTPVGCVAKVWECLFDPAGVTTNKPQDVKLRLLRRLSTINMRAGDSRVAEITLDPYIQLQSLVMARRQLGPKCTFVYKDALSCQATGAATSCDHTLNDCSNPNKVSGAPAGGNRLNFGGFVMVTV
jgi:hypothetical protein